MRVRAARVADLSAIMAIERESFGEVGEEAMATRTLMHERILKCNEREPGWFWVAVSGSAVVGYVILQPTSLDPDACASWNAATDDGTLEKTFDHDGETVFGVSLAVRNGAPSGTFFLLVCQGVILWAQSGKKRLMLCSRLPSMHKAQRDGMAPEMYWRLKDRRGAPRDPLLKMFYSAFGVGPYKFMPDGFIVDKDSCGHAALIVVDDPYKSLQLLAERLYAAGSVDSKTN